MDIVESLEQTFTHAEAVIADVRPDQLGATTPCEEWTVRDLLEHMTGVVAGLGSAAAGESPQPFVLGADPAAQFASAAASALAAWRDPGVLERIVDGGAGPMPGQVLAGISLLDTAVHAWDVATATGQPAELPDAVVKAAMEASKAIVSPEIRPGRFGPEQPAPDGASPTGRLVAFLGRHP
ncbi:MAG: TIGR03086 family metal-binding protein [Acidimicrobiales bacterium]